MNVGIGQQGQQAEVIRRADEVRKHADGFCVEDILAQGERHLQVIANQAQHSFALSRAESPTLTDGICNPHTLIGVAAFTASFAGVVQQGGKV